MRRTFEEIGAERALMYESYKSSGLGLTAYSRKHGVPFWKIRRCVEVMEGRVGGKQSANEPPRPMSRSTSGFQEIVLPPGHTTASSRCEYAVLLRSGRELRLCEGFTVEGVRRLVEVLEGC